MKHAYVPRMTSYSLNPEDVIRAVQAQNIQVAAGQIGQPPTPAGQTSQYGNRSMNCLTIGS